MAYFINILPLLPGIILNVSDNSNHRDKNGDIIDKSTGVVIESNVPIELLQRWYKLYDQINLTIQQTWKKYYC
jgi:hypothetical protein